MKVIVKNNSSDSYSFLNNLVVINPESSTEVSSIYWFSLYTDNNFVNNIRLGNLHINDGIKDYSLQEAENYIKHVTSDFNYNNKDTDGAPIVRVKAAKKGWSFWAVPLEINTSTLQGSLFCQTSDGSNISWINCKIYDGDNDEITSAGVGGGNLLTCVKTVVDFEPTFDYEIIGGTLRINSATTENVRMWIVGAPDIPANQGGSKEFASGINLKFLAPDNSFDIDGRVTKFLTYDPNTHQGKMRVIFKHPAGLNINLQLIIHLYRQ